MPSSSQVDFAVCHRVTSSTSSTRSTGSTAESLWHTGTLKINGAPRACQADHDSNNLRALGPGLFYAKACQCPAIQIALGASVQL